LIELRDDLARRGDAREERLRRSAAALLLLQDRLAQVDALATDVNVARSLDQWANISIALSTKRTERIFFSRAAAAPACIDVPT